jgi:esterase
MELYSKIEGEGKPLLILHGFLGMSDNWKTLGVHFSQQGFQVHMLDLRNHGRSPHSNEFTYAAMVSDLNEYCETHQLNEISVLGHSMGGKVAMFFAAQYPQKVKKLIVADIGVKYYQPHHADILAALNAVDFSSKPTRVDVETIMSEFITDFGTRQFLMKSLYWKEPEQLGFRFNLPVFNEQIDSVGEALPEGALFENPVLFIKGGNSKYILEEDISDIVVHFPNANFETIPNVGHWLHTENPKMFYELVMEFLN